MYFLQLLGLKQFVSKYSIVKDKRGTELRAILNSNFFKVFYFLMRRVTLKVQFSDPNFHVYRLLCFQETFPISN